MAFEWNFRELMRPRLADAYARRTYETLPEQPTNPMPIKMDPQGQGWLAAQQARNAQNMQGYMPNDAKQGYGQDYEDRAQSIAGEVGQDYYGNAGGDRGTTAANIVPEKIKSLQSQIAELEQRITDNKLKLKNWDGNANQIAALEARKINVNDPTSIWRWKAQIDENRRIANAQNKADNTAKANAMIEIANDLDSIIVDDTMTSQDQKAYLSKLSNMKTLGEKTGVPKSVIDSINAKIAEVKREDKQVTEEKPDSVTDEDFEYEGGPRDIGEARATKILQEDPEKITQQTLTTLKRDIKSGKISVSNETKNKIDKLHSQVIDRDKKRVEADKKEERLLKKGKNLSSDDLEFLKGRKGLKHHTDSYGNEWYTRG